jgi:hypothetical protein
MMVIERKHQISLCAALWLWNYHYSDCVIKMTCRNPTIHHVTLGRIASWRTSAHRLNFISKVDLSNHPNPTRFIQSHSFNSSLRVFFALVLCTLECPRSQPTSNYFDHVFIDWLLSRIIILLKITVFWDTMTWCLVDKLEDFQEPSASVF